MRTDNEKIEKALDIALQYGLTAGGHHKMWVIDQMVRVLTDDKYLEWLKNFCDGDEGPATYEWDTGVAP